MPGLTAGAPTTRTGMAPGDAGYGQTGPGYPGRDPLAGTRVGGTPATGTATGTATGAVAGLPDPAPGTGLYTDGERGA
jgi:hypothetical protein